MRVVFSVLPNWYLPGLARAAVMNFSIVSMPALGEPTSAIAPWTSGVTGVKSRSVSYGSTFVVKGLIVWALVVTSSV